VRPVDLLTVGEAFEDLIFAGLPRLPRPGEELRVPSFTTTVGGGAVITAIATARLGLRVGILTAVRPERAAALLNEQVTPYNMLEKADQPAVSVALSTVTDRTFVTFEGVNRSLELRLLDSLRRLPKRPRHIHFALSPARCAAWTPVVKRLRAAGAITSWDFGWNDRLVRDRAFRELARSVDWLFLNEREAKLYADAPSLAHAKRVWRDERANTVIKLGRRGAFAIANGAPMARDAARARVVDTTGAGDAFNGGFLAAILAGADPDQALRLGNYVGARSTEAIGGIASLPTRRALPQWALRCLEAV
jgi:sugar/nucleoside kinase (ribokinase family)